MQFATCHLRRVGVDCPTWNMEFSIFLLLRHKHRCSFWNIEFFRFYTWKYESYYFYLKHLLRWNSLHFSFESLTTDFFALNMVFSAEWNETFILYTRLMNICVHSFLHDIWNSLCLTSQNMDIHFSYMHINFSILFILR